MGEDSVSPILVASFLKKTLDEQSGSRQSWLLHLMVAGRTLVCSKCRGDNVDLPILLGGKRME